jgi:hypothetical protein
MQFDCGESQPSRELSSRHFLQEEKIKVFENIQDILHA